MFLSWLVLSQFSGTRRNAAAADSERPKHCFILEEFAILPTLWVLLMCPCPKPCSRREALNAREKHAEDYGPVLISVHLVGMFFQIIGVNPLRLGWLKSMKNDVWLKKKDHDLAIFNAVYTLAPANRHIAFIYMVNFWKHGE